jgi:hypothetical protein
MNVAIKYKENKIAKLLNCIEDYYLNDDSSKSSISIRSVVINL